MISSFKDFTIGVIASLFASFLTTYALQFIQLGKEFKLKEFLTTIVNYRFFIYWGLLLVVFILIRWFIRKKIEQLQMPYPMVNSIGGNYDLEADVEGYGFKWRVHAYVRRKNNVSNEILDINAGIINGPYCKNDYREMKVYKTYFGRYKYKCPKCGYKRILLKNAWTLECEVKDELEAEYRNNRGNS
ncbi:hypothetical protein CSV71_05840 [Sporosarcina sp. P21c]|uniref:hypothetical protein n=1 Tax=unclassified Sporosarcina TaxID=2647733 RepID=UPI000C165F64|nr:MULTISPECIES: hypothetical protein [unclassified Sporosarcina]PIC67277.1 hypothetical protein CSV78_08055 [Sporosarcina sp. P16a]PIC90221.1 hypothetical protein CSV71_05840 [Sporosarcina sp. P21c]PIC92729.1 hypothetical protein CSV70_08805 [Sporosarcina sp. P25]